jgi:hypothetical protein
VVPLPDANNLRLPGWRAIPDYDYGLWWNVLGGQLRFRSEAISVTKIVMNLLIITEFNHLEIIRN